ncbi:MAG: hypothetical protein EOP47_03120 [Sphingobacteriaceae bacterium]|nr:MAG: hypothetical protein EOP47_03120 [Sphingobacteriaceae bacterium]
MKNIFKVALLATGIFAAAQTQAQTRDTTLGQKIDKGTRAVGKTAKKVGNATADAAKDVGQATATGAKKVGNKTSELASKGAAAVANKRYEGHWALTGELVYIDEYGKFFYVDKKGHRQFITKAQMRTTKP